MNKPLIGLLVIAIALGIVGFLLPTSYRVERQVTILAAPYRIHEYVGHLDKWEEWAPWVKGDRSILITYGDRLTGEGATESWTTDSGQGKLTFTKCDPKTGIAYDLNSAADGTGAVTACTIRYEASSTATNVVWTMEGDAADSWPRVIAGYANLLSEGSISSVFERGLKTLKKRVEG